MRPLLLAVTALALSTPARAQDKTTLEHVTTRGVVLSAGGFEVDVAYKPDGTFSAMDGQVTGKWRIEGGKLCTSSNFAPDEECTAYPAGKTSGHTFEVEGGQGPATIRIK
jgi:hypothetical protein